MDGQDEPPRLTLAEIMASLERSRADVEAGRTVPFETVMAELDASIARIEARRAVAKVTNAA